MILPSHHHEARIAAQRAAALDVSFGLLETGDGPISLVFYAGSPASTLAELLLEEGATADLEQFRIVLPSPVDGLIMASGQPTHVRILSRSGDWWADAAVGDINSDAPVKVSSLDFLPGATVRMHSAIFQG